MSSTPGWAIEELEKIRQTVPDLGEAEKVGLIVAVQRSLIGADLLARVDPTISDGERRTIESLLGRIDVVLESLMDASVGSRDDLADVHAQLATISAQMRSPHPARVIIGSAFDLIVALVSVSAGLATLWIEFGDELISVVERLRS